MLCWTVLHGHVQAVELLLEKLVVTSHPVTPPLLNVSGVSLM